MKTGKYAVLKRCSGCGKRYELNDMDMGWRIDTQTGTFWYCSLECLEKRVG